VFLYVVICCAGSLKVGMILSIELCESHLQLTAQTLAEDFESCWGMVAYVWARCGHKKGLLRVSLAFIASAPGGIDSGLPWPSPLRGDLKVVQNGCPAVL